VRGGSFQGIRVHGSTGSRGGQGSVKRGLRQLKQDLPELLSFFSFPPHLWKQLGTTNVIESCFVEVRRRT
jgi:hypothetical protein